MPKKSKTQNLGKFSLEVKGSYCVEFNCEQTKYIYIHSEGLSDMWKAFRSPLMVNGYCDKYQYFWLYNKVTHESDSNLRCTLKCNFSLFIEKNKHPRLLQIAVNTKHVVFALNICAGTQNALTTLWMTHRAHLAVG